MMLNIYTQGFNSVDQALIAGGADVNAVDSAGNSAVMDASAKGQLEIT
ncbi:MAG: hypothetical protein HQL47_11810 [Gammaproteobacteria bacterium]|nr:hypothetical protein [Gammaproteobacteria bacterium]